MSALRLVLPGCALLLVFCWSVTACQPSMVRPPGFVTSYVPPMANLSVDKLQGRWYMAEHVACQYPANMLQGQCFILDFHYDVNGALVVEHLVQYNGAITSSKLIMPVKDNGVWDHMMGAVPIVSYEVVDWSADDRFLAVACCSLENTGSCDTFVCVRHVEDAESLDDLTALHGRLTRAGVRDADCGFPRDTQPCRPGVTHSHDATRPPAAETARKYTLQAIRTTTNDTVL